MQPEEHLVNERSATSSQTPAGLPTFSILLETENLSSTDPDALERCLATLEAQQLSPRHANEVLLLDSGDPSPDLLADLRAAHSWVQVVRIGEGSDYYEAKLRGAELSTGEVVVLCDSDCTYDAGWLRELLVPFTGNGDVEIVTGETTTRVNGAYGLAMALTYLFPRFSNEDELRAAISYDTNNVAIRRELLLGHPIATGLPMYRGNHVLQARSLRREGHTIWQQPRARAVHPLPNGLSSFLWRFLLLGDEALTIARLDRHAATEARRAVRPFSEGLACLAIAAGRIKRLAQRARSVLREERRRILLLPAAAPIAAAATLLYWAGLAISYAHPGLLLSVYRRTQPD